MINLLLSGIDPEGYYRECRFGDPSLEMCLEAATQLVQDGWRIQLVTLYDVGYRPATLPHEVFDGQPMYAPIVSLEKEWLSLLAIRK